MKSSAISFVGKVKQIYSLLDGPYLGISVSPCEFVFAFDVLSTLVSPDEYLTLTSRQANRDSSLFHITVVTPNEYAAITSTESQAFVGGQTVGFSMLGLGRAQFAEDECFFVVVESLEIQAIRQAVGLPAKDLHITIGFNSSDIHNARKDRTSLLQLERDDGPQNA
jgi:hypothetical protein